MSYILNNSTERYVSNELKERVLVAAKELNYMKSAVASSLKGKNRGIISVLVPQFDNPFFTRIVMAIEEVANQHDYFISISSTVDDMERERKIIKKMIEQRVDGLIISPTIQGTENTDHLRNLGIPYVILERRLVGIDQYDFVGTDNFRNGFLATEHLIENGHSTIGFIGWDTLINVRERNIGYFDAMKKHDLQINDEWIQLGDLSDEVGYELMERCIDSGITAIVLGHHLLAEGAIRLIRERGVRIPNDISVVIIGTPSWTQNNVPRFTCIDQSEKHIGELAGEILLENVTGKTDSAVWQHKEVACEVLFGESVKKLN